jgi:hypothetical protein
LRGGAAVGAGDVAVAIRPGAHVAATVRLDAPGGGGADLALSDDLALGGDGGGGGGDLASSPDLAPPPRYMFLLGMHGSNLGAEAALDGECTSAAAAAGLPATPYKVVIAYPTSSPHDALDLTAGRSIVLPDGTQIATDATFFSSTHLHAIEQLANGQIAHGCVFTDFNPNGDKIAAAAGDCGGWTGASSDVAYVGDSSKSDLNWNFSDTPSCVALSCYLYCIQQQ